MSNFDIRTMILITSLISFAFHWFVSIAEDSVELVSELIGDVVGELHF